MTTADDNQRMPPQQPSATAAVAPLSIRLRLAMIAMTVAWTMAGVFLLLAIRQG